MSAVVVDGKAGVEESHFVFSVARWFRLQRAVHTGCGSGVALSCRVHKVAEQEMRTGTRDKAVVQPVSHLKSNRNVGESYLVLRLVCAPAFWRLSPGLLAVWAALASGLLFRFCLFVRSRRVLLALLRRLVSFSGSVSKRGRRMAPTQRPGFF